MVDHPWLAPRYIHRRPLSGQARATPKEKYRRYLFVKRVNIESNTHPIYHPDTEDNLPKIGCRIRRCCAEQTPDLQSQSRHLNIKAATNSRGDRENRWFEWKFTVYSGAPYNLASRRVRIRMPLCLRPFAPLASTPLDGPWAG